MQFKQTAAEIMGASRTCRVDTRASKLQEKKERSSQAASRKRRRSAEWELDAEICEISI